MSTNFHDPIVAGESNAPATVNTRFSDLDSAIQEVDDRVDTLILSDGSSDAEVVDTRAGYTVLNDRIEDLNFRTGVLLVDPAFNGNSANKRFTTIAAAMSAAAANSTIYIAPGTYTENVVISQHGLKVIGSGTPRYDGTNLVGGTLITGWIDINDKSGLLIRDLGVDVRGGASNDAIVDDRTPGDANNTYENLSFIGEGLSSGAGHGLLLQGGGKNIIRGCRFYIWYHGIALRCSDSIVSDCYFWACAGNSIIVKSETGSGNALNNTITNCVLDGNAADAFLRAGQIRTVSSNASFVTRNTTISNITARNTGEACIMAEHIAGTNQMTLVSNVSVNGGGDHPSRADFDTVGAVSDVHFVNCSSANRAAGYGVRASATSDRIRVIGCNIDAGGAGPYSGTFDHLDIGSGRPVTKANYGHLGVEDPLGSNLLRRSQLLAGKGTALVGVAENFIRFDWNSVAGGFSTVGLEIQLLSMSGGHSTIYTRRVAISRPGTTSIEAAIDTIGTDLASAGGAQGTLSVTVDVATANRVNINVAAVSFAVDYSYIAKIITTDLSVWFVSNLAG